MFIKIKNHLINLAHVTDIIIHEKEKEILFFFSNASDSHLKYTVSGKDGKGQIISQAEYDRLVDLCSIDGYEGADGLLDIMDPFKDLNPLKCVGFEEFLQMEHGAQFVGTKDTIVDGYADWISDMDPEDLIRLGDKYAKVKAAAFGRCRACGCTDEHACQGGCSWLTPAHDLCSACGGGDH